MTLNISKYKEAINKLCDTAIQLQIGMLEDLNQLDKEVNKEVLTKYKPISFTHNYERWYSESIVVLKQLLPDRVSDFILLYKNDKRKITDFATYTLSDYMIGLRVTKGYYNEAVVDRSAAIPKFRQQMLILESVRQRLDSILFDIKHILQADIFDSEIATAQELLKKGFLRAAGAIAGVIIEKHLKEVLVNRNIKISKRNPGIADLNELLKSNDIIDVPQWRHVQLMADIRNLCDHDKSREPKKEEIEDLLSGTNKILKSIF